MLPAVYLVLLGFYCYPPRVMVTGAPVVSIVLFVAFTVVWFSFRIIAQFVGPNLLLWISIPTCSVPRELKLMVHVPPDSQLLLMFRLFVVPAFCVTMIAVLIAPVRVFPVMLCRVPASIWIASLCVIPPSV